MYGVPGLEFGFKTYWYGLGVWGLGSSLGQFRHEQVLGFVEDAGLTCLGFRLQTAPTSNTTPSMNCSWVRAVPKVQRLKAWDSGFRDGGYKTSCTGHSDSRIWGKQSSLFRNKGVRLGILLVSKEWKNIDVHRCPCILPYGSHHNAHSLNVRPCGKFVACL